MADITPPGTRQLTEVERQAFQRLSLTPGHWAALAPAPLFHRDGLRAPNRRNRADLEMTERLRHSLRTIGGLSAEAGHFWERLGSGTRPREATLATRLLAWHLATDLTFARRSVFLQLLRQAAEHFVTRNTYPPRAHDAVLSFRWLVDAYLPYPAFVPDGEPPWVALGPPAADTLAAVAGSIHSPPAASWPLTNPHDVHRLLPALVHALGEPVREWWGQHDPARRAAERGLASLPFAERQRIYSAIFNEWYRALAHSYPSWSNPEDFAQRLVTRMREWVEAVRFAARNSARPTTDEPPHRVEVAPPAPVHPDFIRVPVEVREAKPPPPRLAEKPKPERVEGKIADPFTMVNFDAALARAARASVAEVCAWVESHPPLLFDDCRDEASRQIAVVKTANAVPPALWIIGDVHGDILALANIVTFAESQSTQEQPAHFLFLGDIVDRGIHDHETLLFLFRLMMDHPQRVCFLPGNHDIDLQFDEATNRFRVTIEPAEYCENLNAAIRRDTPEDRDAVALAHAFIRFCERRPKAVFLPDGTLIAHGGFPHTDMQKEIATLADLCRPKCIDDFLWARIAESARVKRPNRGSRGHEFGWDTFAQFCKLAKEKLELPVQRLIRGHDHVTDRWQEYPDYAENGVPVVTLNAMGRLLDGEPARRDGRPHPFPVVARRKQNHLPEVLLLPLDAAEVDRAFPKPQAAPESEGGA